MLNNLAYLVEEIFTGKGKNMKFTIMSLITLLTIAFTTNQASARSDVEIYVGPWFSLNITKYPRNKKLKEARRKCMWLIHRYEKTGFTYYKRKYRNCIKKYTH